MSLSLAQAAMVFVTGVIGAMVGLAGHSMSKRAKDRETETQRDLGLVDRWRELAEASDERAKESEERMNARFDIQAGELAGFRKRLAEAEATVSRAQEAMQRAEDARHSEQAAHARFRRIAAHQVALLVNHIDKRLDPPAPDLVDGWPEDLPIPQI